MAELGGESRSPRPIAVSGLQQCTPAMFEIGHFSLCKDRAGLLWLEHHPAALAPPCSQKPPPARLYSVPIGRHPLSHACGAKAAPPLIFYRMLVGKQTNPRAVTNVQPSAAEIIKQNICDQHIKVNQTKKCPDTRVISWK